MTAQAITPQTLPSIAWNNQPVITTELLADVYGTVVDNIQKNFERNKTRFVEGVHYFLLKGTDLKAFKNQVTDSYLVDNLQVTNSHPQKLHPTNSRLQISNMVRSLYLWTERGAVRHAKILDTDKAWEVQAQLEDFYFSKKSPKQHTLTDYIKEPRQTKPAVLNEKITAQQKIIMMMLASKADKDGKCQMSLTELAPLCGIEKSTTSKNLTVLIEAGFLSTTKSYGAKGGSLPNTYVIPKRFRVVEGELVEPAMLEHRPAKGMTSISVDDLNAKAIKWENLTDDMRYSILCCKA